MRLFSGLLLNQWEGRQNCEVAGDGEDSAGEVDGLSVGRVAPDVGEGFEGGMVGEGGEGEGGVDECGGVVC